MAAIKITRSQEQLDDLMNEVAQAAEGGTKFPGMSYEDGITAVVEWLDGRGNNPME